MGDDPEFERQVEAKYISPSGRTPFPGADAANEYHEEEGEPHHARYLSSVKLSGRASSSKKGFFGEENSFIENEGAGHVPTRTNSPAELPATATVSYPTTGHTDIGESSFSAAIQLPLASS
jgi:hypothetical protein